VRPSSQLFVIPAGKSIRGACSGRWRRDYPSRPFLTRLLWRGRGIGGIGRRGGHSNGRVVNSRDRESRSNRGCNSNNNHQGRFTDNNRLVYSSFSNRGRWCIIQACHEAPLRITPRQILPPRRRRKCSKCSPPSRRLALLPCSTIRQPSSSSSSARLRSNNSRADCTNSNSRHSNKQHNNRQHNNRQHNSVNESCNNNKPNSNKPNNSKSTGSNRPK